MFRWIHHLPLRHKFLVLSLVAFLMTAAPSVLVLSTSWRLYEGLQAEQAGLPPGKVLLQLVRLTQEHRGLSSAVLSGEATKQADRVARQTAIDETFAQVHRLYQDLPRQALMPELAALQRDWRGLADRVTQAGVSPADSLKQHTALIERLLHFVEDEVGASGMALDADTASYYLITAAFRDLPRLSEKMGLARARGTMMLVKRSTDADQRSVLLTLADAAQGNRQDMERAVAKAAAGNPDAVKPLRTRLDEALAAHTAMHALVSEVAHQADTHPMAPARYFDETTVAIKKQFALSEAVLHELDVLLAERAQAEATRVVVTLVVVALMLGLGAAVASGISRNTSAAMRRAVESAEALARGDLSPRASSDQRDEAGQLLRAMASATDQLRLTIGGIRDASQSVATASSQIAQGNLDLSSRTESQASSLQQTASSMEEMSATVRHNADTALQANQLALQVSQGAAESGRNFTLVTEKMEAIKQASNKIAEINAVIDGIAFQTNILALNAAVEAARAGEQGRGFAVVAGEVRTLAQRSANAAREIKSLIGDSVSRVEEGCGLATQTGQSIERVITQIQQVSQLIGEVASGNTEQSQGIAQVNQAVTHLDHATQQNAALVEESSAAAASLSDQADRLQSAVGRFRLA
ncbi:MAG: HAMP domain-containing protein [Burkholderiales bacterium]|nr:HAMP domain-containing protein [Burkholderiales bacterium]